MPPDRGAARIMRLVSVLDLDNDCLFRRGIQGAESQLIRRPAVFLVCYRLRLLEHVAVPQIRDDATTGEPAERSRALAVLGQC